MECAAMAEAAAKEEKVENDDDVDDQMTDDDDDQNEGKKFDDKMARAERRDYVANRLRDRKGLQPVYDESEESNELMMDDGDGEEGKSEPQNGHRHDLRKRKVKKPYGAVQKELNKIKDKSQKLNREAVPESDDCDGPEIPGDRSKGHSTTMLLVIPAILIVVIVATFLMRSPSFQTEQPNFHSEEIFESKVKDLKKKFKRQDDILWNAVLKLGKQHIMECHNTSSQAPDRPLVFVFTSIRKYQESLQCFAKSIGMAFAGGAESVMLNGNEMAKKSESKADLDRELESMLKSKEQLIIFTELGSLPYETASIFFKYCDNENAPYPKAVFIFTLSLDRDESFLIDLSRKEMTSETRNYLSTVAWKDGDKGQSDALIARILDPYPLPVMKEAAHLLKEC